MNVQTQLWQAGPRPGGYGEASSAHNKSLSMHRWANWIAGFSGEFAHNAITQFLPRPRPNPLQKGEGILVLDPFAGVGTTLVEANRLGLNSIGFEINPFAALVCRVKLGRCGHYFARTAGRDSGLRKFHGRRGQAGTAELAARRIQEPHSLFLPGRGAQGFTDPGLYERLTCTD